MSRIAFYILRFRKIIIICVTVVTIVLGYFIKDLRINPDVFDSLPDDDPVAVLFKRIGEDYGGNYSCIIGLEAEDIFTTVVLEHIRQITDTLKLIPGVGSVVSLTNVIDIRGSDWGIEIGQLVDYWDLPEESGELERLKQYVLSSDMYGGTLVSGDATMTIIVARLQEGVEKIGVARVIREKVMALELPVKLVFGGQPFIIEGIGNIITGDLKILGPFSFLVILVVLYLGFRSLRGVLLPVITVVLSIIWTFGIMGLLKIELSIITSIIPVLLVAIGSAYTIHVFNRVVETDGRERKAALQQALTYIMIPVFFTSLTTIFGFLSFVFGSYLAIISIFGIFTSVGIFIALLLSLTFVPAILASFGQGTRVRKGVRPGLLTVFLQFISQRVHLHPGRLLLIWTVVLMVFAIGIFRVERRVDFMDYFKQDDPNRQTEEVLKKKMGGTYPVYVSVRGEVLDPVVLQMIDSTTTFLLGVKNMVNAQSVADLFGKMNEVMGEGNRVPDDPAKIWNLWFLLEGQEVLEQLISENLDEAVINGTFSSTDIGECKDLGVRMDQYFSSHLSDKWQMEISGLPGLVVRLDESLIKSQFRSLGIAIVLVFLAVSLFMRSLLKGAVAILPIIATLIILYGFMGWTGIPLDIATVLVGSISIGIGIDYSIHMISHIGYEERNGNNMEQAVRHAIQVSGKSILINVCSVTFGFLVLTLSSLVPLQRFGLLVGVTMVSSGLGSLLLLPAMMVFRKTRKDNKKI